MDSNSLLSAQFGEIYRNTDQNVASGMNYKLNNVLIEKMYISDMEFYFIFQFLHFSLVNQAQLWVWVKFVL